MCGRYSLKNVPTHLREYFKLHGRLPPLGPRYNIAPTQFAPVIGTNPETLERSMVEMRWGLVPSWAKELSLGNKMFNARAETLSEKPAFRSLLGKRRCIIPASGFYEWEKVGKERLPYYFHLKDDQPMGLAGLWSTWNHNGEKLQSFTIVTTEANEALADIHSRMPVILTEDKIDAWLDSQVSAEEAVHILEPIEAKHIERWRVSKDINRAALDAESMIVPLPLNSL